MYIRTVTRRNKDGSTVRYLQLAHNERDPRSGVAKAKVLYNFGRAEDLDQEALRRLIRSVRRFLEPEERPEGVAGADDGLSEASGLRPMAARSFGGAWALDGLWRALHLDAAIERALRLRGADGGTERALFGLVASRALAPSSKLSTVDWMTEIAALPGWPSEPLPDGEAERLAERKRRVNLLYRAMDVLAAAEGELQKEVFWAISGGDLLELDVDLLFFDTSNVYFEVEDEDGAGTADGSGLRRRGHSKEQRDDLPLVTIGLAVTRRGLPIRCWVWPGNTADVSVIGQVKRDLLGWRLGRVVTVVDRGFTSEENVRTLQLNGGHVIAGEKLRRGRGAAQEALARQGRYRTVRDNLEVKEVVVGHGEARKRYVLVRNPQEVERDRQERQRILTRLRAELAEIDRITGGEHTQRVCALRANEAYKRYLGTDSRGRPRVDAEKVRAEERLDGKFLLQTSDDTLSPEDVALGYKQLIQVEDAFRTLKTTLEIRPVYHRLEERIRSHVVLCWLALLMVRVIEEKTGRRWPAVRHDLEQMHLIEYRGPHGTLHRRTEATHAQRQVFGALGLSEPPAFPRITVAGAPAS